MSVRIEDMLVKVCVFICTHTYTTLLEHLLSDYRIFMKLKQNGYQFFYGWHNFLVLFIHTRFCFFAVVFYKTQVKWEITSKRNEGLQRSTTCSHPITTIL